MKLIAGLGNPGARYARTRHNVGFMVVDKMASLSGVEFSKRFDGQVGRGSLNGVEVLFVKPLTFMNLSGQCIAPVVRFFNIELKDLLVIHDDVDLEMGRVMVKMGGGDGGHRGLRSVIDELMTNEFARIRIGVGRPDSGGEVLDYVLSPFPPDEEEQLAHAIDKAVIAANEFIVNGLESAQRKTNRRERLVSGDRTPSCPGQMASGPLDRKEVS